MRAGHISWTVCENDIEICYAEREAEAVSFMEWMVMARAAGHNNGLLQIHAGAASRNGRGVIFPAPPGGGKTTLLAALALRGWRYLSDEIAFINRGTFQVLPFPRSCRLDARAARLLGLAKESPGPSAHTSSNRRLARLTRRALGQQATINAVVFLDKGGRRGGMLVEMSPRDAVAQMVRLMFNPTEGDGAMIEAAVELVRRTPCFSMRRAPIWNMVDAIEQMLDDLSSLQRTTDSEKGSQ